MSLSTYAQLTASIGDWLNRPDLGGMIPDFVRLCEADLQRRLVHVRGLADIASLTTTAGAVTLPDDFNGVLSVKSTCRLKFVPPDVLYGYADASGIATEYTLIGDQMVLYPEPSDGTAVTLAYKVKLDLLTTGTSWVLTNHPDAYLFGSLMNAEPYMGDDMRVPMWGKRYEDIMRSIELDGIRQATGGSLQLKPNWG
jgi:hypothetical protein